MEIFGASSLFCNVGTKGISILQRRIPCGTNFKGTLDIITLCIFSVDHKQCLAAVITRLKFVNHSITVAIITPADRP